MLVLGENVRILDDLGEADRVGYILTLLGEDDAGAFYATLEEEDFSPTGGCTRSAIEQLFDEELLLHSYENPVDALVDLHPRVLAAVELWAECMREEGFDYHTADVMEAEFEDRFDAIEEAIEEGDPGASEALTELQGEELFIAVLDQECETEFVDPVAEAVEFELTGLRAD